MVKKDTSIVLVERVQSKILYLRSEKVIIDSDLADLYGVPTKRLNEQIKRNHERFPPDFMFQLTKAEKDEVVANCDHLRKLKFSPVLPYAFTRKRQDQAREYIRCRHKIDTEIPLRYTICDIRYTVFMRMAFENENFN